MPDIRVWISWKYPWGSRVSTYTTFAHSTEAAIKEANRIYAKRMEHIVRITAEVEN